MKSDGKRILGGAAVLLGLAIVGGAFFYASDDDSSTEDPPASPADATEASSAPADSNCTLEVESVVYTLDPLVGQQFAALGISFDTISPGNEVAEGTATAPRIHVSRDVSCDLTSGYVGMRGGFRVSNERDTVEFRRFRVDLDEGEMYTFFKSTGSESVEAVDIEASEAQFTERGAVFSAVVPMVLDTGAAVALNATLGTDLPADTLELGTITFTGSTSGAQTQ
ncbi:MAG: hypothetical protein OEM67_08510 [Thermoleophilia bacterium]|nr:hypothetical protein [Thermoleophilia bacterium]